MKKKNKVWLALATISIVLLIFRLYMFIDNSKEIIPIDYQHKIDSLSNLILIQNELNAVLEEDYYRKLDSLETNNKREVERLKRQFQLKLTTVRELPIDSQIKYFEEHLQVDKGYAKKIVENQDTSIQISVGQLIESNQAFVELDYMYDLKDELDSQLDSCYSLLDYSRVVLKEKNQEIDLLNSKNKEKGNYISDLNKTLLEQRKIAKKRNIRNSIISGAVGIIIGVLISK